jgi:hypothetical protein
MNRKEIIYLIVALLFCFFLVAFIPEAKAAAPSGTPQYRVNKVLKAMRQVESGGRDHAIGDQGRSRGPLQIQAPYWREATKHGRVNWDYRQNVYDWDKSQAVTKMYWKRYAPEAYRRGDMKTLARIHNGGPKGDKNPATEKYWRKVQKAMR